MDINQCDDDDRQLAPTDIVPHFRGTHKCDRASSACRFERGHGWIRGGYACTCLKGFYSALIKNATFNGSHVERNFCPSLFSP